MYISPPAFKDPMPNVKLYPNRLFLLQLRQITHTCTYEHIHTRGLEDREQGQMDQEEETGKASQGAEMKDTQIKR